MQTNRCIGIDGCKSGWICVSRVNAAGQLRAQIIDQMENLEFNTYDFIAIDIPIGLPVSGSRACDVGARVILKPRGCCVFPAPIRPLLDAEDYAKACAIKFAIDGNKISRQAWGIMPKIAEVDELLQSREELRTKVIEVHPEVSFCCMNNQVPLLLGKKSCEGKLNRLTLIDLYFGAGTIKYLKNSLVGNRGWGDDDLLDACAALWTAERIQLGIAQSIPNHWSNDETGIPMRIVY